MNGSYWQHSLDTEEFLQGKNEAMSDGFLGVPRRSNPYPPSSKEWLDWSLGAETIIIIEEYKNENYRRII